LAEWKIVGKISAEEGLELWSGSRPVTRAAAVPGTLVARFRKLVGE
jgi:hypothetical protein